MKKTEYRNPNTMNIDKVSTLEALKMMDEENTNAAKAVSKVLPDIAKGVDLIVDAFNDDGRLVYIGAGTSGRLGVLDASECPPTFGVSPNQVVGIIAGGNKALTTAVEGAEDDPLQGEKDVKEINLSSNDVLVGISVAGDAKYVYNALKYAQSIGAKTIALTSNDDALIIEVSDVSIITDTGAEVITGSTRLKAGTAHKMVLNMLTTISMVKTGKVIENLMVNVAPTNIKLIARAKRIIKTLTDLNDEEIDNYLKQGKTVREIIESNKK